MKIGDKIKVKADSTALDSINESVYYQREEILAEIENTILESEGEVVDIYEDEDFTSIVLTFNISVPFNITTTFFSDEIDEVK